MYVYIESEHNAYGSLWTVGFYNPAGKFVPESDHESETKAAERVHWLNGGNDTLEVKIKADIANDLCPRLQAIEAIVDRLAEKHNDRR